MAVHPAYQGRGLGRSMTLLGLHHLRETGIGEAFLYVDGDNEAARRTYDSLGFQSLANETMFTHTSPSVSGTMVPMSASADARVESEAPVPPLTEPLTAAPVGGRMPDSAAVSYTHLDVYKRQDLDEADEIFSTGNYGKVVPCTRYEGRELNTGPVAQLAKRRYFEWAKTTSID